MRKILTQQFFRRDTKLVARELLGKFLVRRLGGREIAVMITETEAYQGFDDEASHAFKGLTKRTEIMFGHPGYWYIYLCYGMYYLLNISTREKGMPAAVLIRGVEGAEGPGKLTRLLNIDKELNGHKASSHTDLWLEDRGISIPKNKILSTPRIGINYAGEKWRNKKWRYLLKK